MGTVYSISKNDVVIESNQVLLTYGIVAENENGEKMAEFSDVSVNKNFTEDVVNLLNGCRVELCHFYDVVIDELNR